ncbi:hypothetical protein CAJAP_04243 [Camponotus japonicus]
MLTVLETRAIGMKMERTRGEGKEQARLKGDRSDVASHQLRVKTEQIQERSRVRPTTICYARGMVFKASLPYRT